MLREIKMTRSLERAYMPAISWGAVFAGGLFAFSFATLLYLFGAAIGVTTIAALNEFRTGIAIGTAVWMVLAWAFSHLAGGWMAGRFAGRTDPRVGAMHGAVVWAVLSLVAYFAYFLPLGGAVANGARSGGQLLQASGQAAAGVQLPPEIRSALRAQLVQQSSRVLAAEAPSVTQEEARMALQRMDDPTMNRIAASLIMGRPQEAERVLAANTNLSEREISEIVSGTSAAMSQRLAGFAEGVADIAGTALWVLFLISLLGLGAASWGGVIGAHRAERFLESNASSSEPEEPAMAAPRIR